MLLLGITAFSAIASTVLGLYSLRFRAKGKATKYFAALCFIIMAWLLVMAESLAHPGLGIIRATMVLAAAMTAVLFLFTYHFVSEKVNRSVVGATYVVGAAVTILALTPLVFSSVVIEGANAYPVAGIGMIVFVPYAFTGLFASFVLLARVILHEPERTMLRVQVEWITVGLIGTMLLMIVPGFVVVNIWHTDRFVPLSMLSTLLFIGCTTYAMTRYRFLDVRVLFKKSLLYAVCLSALATAYAAAALQVYYFLRRNAEVDPIVWLVGVMLIFIILFEVLHKRVKTFLDGKFFVEVIDFTNIIHEGQAVMNSSHEIESYVLQLAGLVQAATRAKVEQIFIRQRQFKRFNSFYPLKSCKYLLFADEVAVELAEKKVRGIHLVSEMRKKGIGQRLQKFLRKHRAHAYMTVDGADGEIIAIVIIGQHKNHFALERADLDKLPPIQEEASRRILYALEMQRVFETARLGHLER